MKDSSAHSEGPAASTEKLVEVAKPRRKWLRRMLWTVMLLIALPGAYLGASWVGSRIAVHGDFEEDPRGVEIYLYSNGAHAEVWVPRNWKNVNWSEWLGVGGYSSYLSLGWGDRRFFMEMPTWDDLTLGIAAPALLWPTESAMRVQSNYLPKDATPLRISEVQYEQLVAALRAGFALESSTGKPRLIPWEPWPGTRGLVFFFHGRDGYHALRTCNVWTAQVLKAAGIRTALWSPFAAGVVRQWPRAKAG